MNNLFDLRKKLAILFTIYTIVEIIVVFVFSDATVLSNWMMLIAPSLSLFIFISMIKKLSVEQRLFWIFIAIGIFSEIMAQATWSYYDWVLDSPTPDLSEADIWWSLQSVSFITALIVRCKSTLYGVRYSLDMLIILVGTVAISWNYLIYPILTTSDEFTKVRLLVDLFYPISDLIILLLTLLLVYNRKNMFHPAVNKLLIIGFLVYITGDSLYLLFGDLAGYEIDNLLNPIWLAATFLLTLACIHSDQIASDKVITEGEADKRKRILMKMLFPYAVLVSLVVLMLFELGLKNSVVSAFVISVLLILFRQVTVMVENEELLTQLKDALEQTEYLASHDGLTSLYNRRTFEEKLSVNIQESGRLGRRMALMFFDLDHFKQINDTYGHDMGDALLKAVAERMEQLKCKDMILARLGGDEFIVLLPHMKSDQEIHEHAEVWLKAITEPLINKGIVLRPSTSIGISIYPDHGQNLNDLMKSADTAMYRSKEKGSNRYTIYE